MPFNHSPWYVFWSASSESLWLSSDRLQITIKFSLLKVFLNYPNVHMLAVHLPTLATKKNRINLSSRAFAVFGCFAGSLPYSHSLK